MALKVINRVVGPWREFPRHFQILMGASFIDRLGGALLFPDTAEGTEEDVAGSEDVTDVGRDRLALVAHPAGDPERHADEADDVIFGYTCVNDVTAADLLFADPAFQQWTLAKGFDTFCPLGPCIDTDIDPAELRVLAIENGEIRQDYPVSDMIYSPQQIVSMISRYQTLVPGDLIVCGTSVGASPMKPGCEIQVSIPGLGTLVNHFDDRPE